MSNTAEILKDYIHIGNIVLPDMLRYDCETKRPFSHYCITKSSNFSVYNWLTHYLHEGQIANADEKAFNELCEILRHYGRDILPNNFEFSKKKFDEWANKKKESKPISLEKPSAYEELSSILNLWASLIFKDEVTIDWGFEVRDWAARYCSNGETAVNNAVNFKEAFIKLVQIVSRKVNDLDEAFPAYDFVEWMHRHMDFKPSLELMKRKVLYAFPSIQQFDAWATNLACDEVSKILKG